MCLNVKGMHNYNITILFILLMVTFYNLLFISQATTVYQGYSGIWFCDHYKYIPLVRRFCVRMSKVKTLDVPLMNIGRYTRKKDITFFTTKKRNTVLGSVMLFKNKVNSLPWECFSSGPCFS